MALDYASLLSIVADYNGSGNINGAMLLKLALLKNIAASVAPMAATDFQSLLNNSNLPGWSSCSNASIAGLLEMSLLAIIANGISGGTGTGATFGNYAGSTPNFTPAGGTGLAVDTSTENLWAYNNGAWHQLV